MKAPEWRALVGLATTGIWRRPTSPSPPGPGSISRCPVWIFAICALLAAGAWWSGHASEPQPPIPLQAQRSLELEDWPALLNGLAADPLTNTIPRLAVVRALFETGRLPEDQFSWLHRPGPELLSTADLKEHIGSAHIAETLLQLGHLNAAERLAFNSLEMEGETPAVLRTLARLHVVRGLPNAARIFLNRLQAYPEHCAWAVRLRAGLATNSPATADPTISRIRTNVITRDGIVTGLTTERLLRQALESNPGNRMAFQFLMAHQLLDRRLPNAMRTLVGSPQTREGPLPRHYAEALLLGRDLDPNLSAGTLLSRVPPAVVASFQGFKEMMNRAPKSPEQVQPQAWRDFGNTYWYYYFFAPLHPPNRLTNPGNS